MVEFALILPVLMIFLYGGFQVLQALSIYRRLSDTTVEMANIATQYPVLSAAEVQGIMAESAQVMYPNSTTKLQLVTTLVTTDNSGNATVKWSQGWNGGTCIANGSAYTLPANLNAPNATYIVVSSSYTYTPSIAVVYTPTFAPMNHTIYMVPRVSSTIPCTSCTC